MSVSSVSIRRVKVVLLGEAGVGKTAIVTRFTDDYWIESPIATIGVDFAGRTIYIEERATRVQIWDTAGQERFHSLIPSYIREAEGAVIVFDVTSRKSFDEISRWLEEVREKAEEEAVIVLVGNKVDDISKREISVEEAKKFAEANNLLYMEVSARNGQNVNELFDLLASKIGHRAMPYSKEQRNAAVINLEDSYVDYYYDEDSNSCSC